MKVSVSQLNAYVKQCFNLDTVLSNITVCGEISGLKFHSSGHIYFSLKDEGAVIRCAFFKPHSLNITFRPEDGMKVIAKGKVTLFERDGQYQLNVFSMEQDGTGNLYKEFELLKKKLGEEGLFDEQYKKPIPKYVKKIGVVTSPTGAVIRDIINVSTRRCPNIQILLAPVSVQGEDAPRSICAGLDALENRDDIDVIIVGRGGGSMEDLWCFNSELIARKIFSMNTPVISAVGHETDFTICDFVSDLRAPTPSAAAELAVFDFFDTVQNVDYLEKNLEKSISYLIKDKYLKLSGIFSKFKDPENLLVNQQRKIEILSSKLDECINERLNKAQNSFLISVEKIEALSPMNVLKRGYSVVFDKDGKIVSDSKNVKKGDGISIKLNNGNIVAEVK